MLGSFYITLTERMKECRYSSIYSLSELGRPIHRHDLAAATQRCPHYSLERWLGGPQNQCGRCREKKNPCLYRELNPGRPTHSLTNSMEPSIEEVIVGQLLEQCLVLNEAGIVFFLR
jgi:hypothetical protein